MSIPESTLAKWSHHKAGTAFKQAHVPIRKALEAHRGLSQFKYEVFLQGSYKNDTNLGGDSDVDVVVRLSSKLKPAVADLTGDQLQKDGSHRFLHQQWNSFRGEALKALRGRFGSAAASGRKTLKVPKGRIIPADADLVVTVSHMEGIGFYLSDEQRWVVSFPQQHHSRGLKKEKAANNRFKRTIRMFKAARNRLVAKKMLARGRCALLLHRMPSLQRSRQPVQTEAGADVYGHPRLAGDGEAQGLQVPERAGGAVRFRAGTVVSEKGAGVHQGASGHVGHLGLKKQRTPGSGCLQQCLLRDRSGGISERKTRICGLRPPYLSITKGILDWHTAHHISAIMQRSFPCSTDRRSQNSALCPRLQLEQSK